MALAGLLRAEAVLAVANGIFLVLIMFGGVIIPAASLPGPLSAVAPLAPLRGTRRGPPAVLVDGSSPSCGAVDGAPRVAGSRRGRVGAHLPLVVG